MRSTPFGTCLSLSGGRPADRYASDSPGLTLRYRSAVENAHHASLPCVTTDVGSSCLAVCRLMTIGRLNVRPAIDTSTFFCEKPWT